MKLAVRDGQWSWSGWRIGCAVALLIFLAVRFWLAASPSHHASSLETQQVSRSSTAQGTASDRWPVLRPVTEPIESLRVGQRVLALNPEVSFGERQSWSEPDWQQWVKLSLTLPKEDGSQLHMELLRPEAWLRAQLAGLVSPSEQPSLASDQASAIELDDAIAAPGRVPLAPLRAIYRQLAATDRALELSGHQLNALLVEMELPELLISGPAILEDLCNAPPIAPGSGSVITATFRHTSAEVLDLVIGDQAAAGQVIQTVQLESRETIGTTAHHPFWSADRQAYVAAQGLEIGERVQTFAGDTKRVLAKLPRPGPETVYNLEVHGEHVYFIGQHGILVHNTCDTDNAILKSIRRHAERLVAKKTKPSDPEVNSLVTAIRRALHQKNVRLAGTYFHSLNFWFAKGTRFKRGIENPIVTPKGSSKVFRKPDYNTGDNFFDLKPRKTTPDHYDFTEQFFDIFETTGSLPIPLYYKLRL